METKTLITALLFLLFILPSCRTTDGYRQAVELWVGASEQELVEGWGMPDNSYKTDTGEKVIAYNRNDTIIIPGGTTYQRRYVNHSGSIYGNGGYANYSGYSTVTTPVTRPDSVVPFVCNTTFFLNKKNEVSSVSFEGNDCKAEEQEHVQTGSCQVEGQIKQLTREECENINGDTLVDVKCHNKKTDEIWEITEKECHKRGGVVTARFDW